MSTITDPSELVKGRRYVSENAEHPEWATSLGTFDGIRPDPEDGDDCVYFVDGEIGGVPQSIFGFPADQPYHFRESAD